MIIATTTSNIMQYDNTPRPTTRRSMGLMSGRRSSAGFLSEYNASSASASGTTAPRRSTGNTISPKRPSAGFVNDYNISSASNLAPAAVDDRFLNAEEQKKAELKQQEEWAAKISSRFVPVRKSGGISLSPPRTTLPTQERSKPPSRADLRRSKTPSRADLRGGFWNQSTRFLRKIRDPSLSPPRTTPPTQEVSQTRLQDGLQVDLHTKHPVEHPEKNKSKDRRKVFQRLSDEKVPEEKKLKNRKLKSDYIESKFGDMFFSLSNRRLSESTVTTATLGELISEIPPPAIKCTEDDDIEDFVEGLVFFAPTSENTIRELVRRSSQQNLFPIPRSDHYD